MKNCIVFNNTQIPHFNYVGDSIIGSNVLLGAGVKISNLKLNQSTVRINLDGTNIDTGLKKFGSIIGDNVAIGCNSVLNPGTIVGVNSTILPCISVKGLVPEYSKITENYYR